MKKSDKKITNKRVACGELQVAFAFGKLQLAESDSSPLKQSEQQ